MKLCGALLVLLSCVLAGANYLSLAQNIAAKHGKITMITIAAYTFYRITVVSMKAVKQRKTPSPLLAVIRTISYAEVAASLLTMQRSMLASFGESDAHYAKLLNSLTGGAVWLFVLVLGAILMMKGIKRKEKLFMDKSKLTEVGEKIAETVTGAYKKVEDTVVGGYKKVEDTVVGGYKKVEDSFVERYLTHEGESIEEAKERLKKEQEQQ